MVKLWALLVCGALMVVAGIAYAVKDPSMRKVFVIVSIVGAGICVFAASDLWWWFTTPDAVSSASRLVW